MGVAQTANQKFYLVFHAFSLFYLRYFEKAVESFEPSKLDIGFIDINLIFAHR